jgi:hypothetical protein
MQRQDWLLLVLCAAHQEGLTPVQLQKSLFLVGQELPRHVRSHFYAFFPYNYGPFDPQICRDADRLGKDGFVAIRTDGRRSTQRIK